MALAKTKKNLVQVDDFSKLKHPRGLALSPDGKLLAYTLWRCDLAKKKYFTTIDVINTTTGAVSAWTFGEVNDRGLSWSKDGRKLAFLRYEQGVDRVYVISRDGGNAEKVYQVRGSISEVKWANADTLILKIRNADPDAEADKAVAEGKTPSSSPPSHYRITRLFYRLDGDGFMPEDRYHLYKFDLKSKKLEQITFGKWDTEGWDISVDGSFVAFITNIHRDPERHSFNNQIFTYNLKTKKTKAIGEPFGQKDAVAISPNGKFLVYLGHHNVKDAWGVEVTHPWLVDLKTLKYKNLTPKFDRQANDATIGDLGYGLGAPLLKWSADSKSVFYQVSKDGDTYIARKNLVPGTPERFWNGHGQCVNLSVAGKAMALIHLSFSSTGDIYFKSDSSNKRSAFKKLTNFNQEYFAKTQLGAVREIYFKSADGQKVHGYLMTPPNFSKQKKYPGIIQVHGGPRAQYGRVFFHEMQFLAAKGYVVFYTNPRGSQGYGRAFADAITANWGTKDYEDVMAAADWLESQKFIDKNRMGITGGSYGGYMTNIVVGRTQRFKAAITQRSVVDLYSFLGSSDIGFMDNFEFGGYAWENPEGYKKMNPLTYVDNIRTPLLISHSECDYRCAIEQAEQLFAHLKVRGRTVEFLRFPEEFHGLSRGGRADRRVIRLNAFAEWFGRYLKK